MPAEPGEQQQQDEPNGSRQSKRKDGAPEDPQSSDYYRLLGVRRDATEKEIKDAYRRHARKLHPDVNPDPEKQEKFKEITNAYNILTTARDFYDSFQNGDYAGDGIPTDFTAFLMWANISPELLIELLAILPEDGMRMLISITAKAKQTGNISDAFEPTASEDEVTANAAEVPQMGKTHRSWKRFIPSPFKSKEHQGNEATQEGMEGFKDFVTKALADYSHMTPPAAGLLFILPNGKRLFLAQAESYFDFEEGKTSDAKYVIGEIQKDHSTDSSYIATRIEVSESQGGKSSTSFSAHHVKADIDPSRFITYGITPYNGFRDKWQYPPFEVISDRPVRDRDLRRSAQAITQAANR